MAPQEAQEVEAVTLTFVDTKEFLNPAFIDSGVCCRTPRISRVAGQG